MIVLMKYLVKAIALIIAIGIMFWFFLVISILLWDLKFLAIWSETIEEINSI